MLVALCALTLSAAPFKDGDVVAFFGDSITSGGTYIRNLEDYYLTRYPRRNVRFVNVGSGGSTATSSLRRLGDVLACNPTHVFIMFGMNDAGFMDYGFTRTPAQYENAEKSLRAFRTSYTNMLARLRREGNNPQLILMTPSPYDDRLVVKKGYEDKVVNRFGYRDALGRCAAIVRELAAAEPNAELVDLYSTMTQAMRLKQRTEPGWTLAGWYDRVHPGERGHFFMTWRILLAQNADAVVSDVSIDAEKLFVAKALKAEVGDLTRAADGLSWTMREESLPLPVPGEVKAASDVIPLEIDVNQELLTVTGLAEGSYKLTIDGRAVATHTAKEWSDGVNLAFNEATPQHGQARAIQRLNRERHHLDYYWRELKGWDVWIRRNVKNPADPAAVTAFVEKQLADPAVPDYRKREIRRQWENSQDPDALLKRRARLTEEIEAMRGMKPHAYRLIKK